MLLLFFTHTHLTVTVTLGLLLVPKVSVPLASCPPVPGPETVSVPLHQFLFAGTHMRDDMASEAYEDELDMGRSGSYLNSSITSAWSEHSLDPEDIRVGRLSTLRQILPHPPKTLSGGSFCLQTPEETGPLSRSFGCGARSRSGLWEKRTNVSRDSCLSVRAEDVSTQGLGLSPEPQKPTQHLSLEAVSDLTLLLQGLSWLFFSASMMRGQCGPW